MRTRPRTATSKTASKHVATSQGAVHLPLAGRLWADRTLPSAQAASVAPLLILEPEGWCLSTGPSPVLRRWTRMNESRAPGADRRGGRAAQADPGVLRRVRRRDRRAQRQRGVRPGSVAVALALLTAVTHPLRSLPTVPGGATACPLHPSVARKQTGWGHRLSQPRPRRLCMLPCISGKAG